MTRHSPLLTLNNGIQMLAVGLGVFQSPPEAAQSVSNLALVEVRRREKLLADGCVRAIGVSNFMPEHLQRLLAETSIVPAVNQIAEINGLDQGGAAGLPPKASRWTPTAERFPRRDHERRGRNCDAG